MSVVIRSMIKKDIPKVHHIIKDAQEKGYLESENPNFHLSATDGFSCLVAEENGEVVGFLSYTSNRYTSLNFLLATNFGLSPVGRILRKQQPMYYVWLVCVATEYRRRGIGTLLYNHVKELAQKKGYVMSASVVSEPLNKQSYDFHKKNGFSLVERYTSSKPRLFLVNDLNENG